MSKFRSILLIDDDPIHNYIVVRLLKQLHLSDQIVTFRNGLEGINFMENASEGNYPELILLDLNMPVKSGREFMEFLKKDSLNSFKGKLIVITANLHKHDREWLSQHELCGVLIKPLTREKLLPLLS